MPVKNFDLSIIVFEKSTGTCFVYITVSDGQPTGLLMEMTVFVRMQAPTG